MPTLKATTLVIGVGNAHRGDDAVGPVVVARLKQHAGDKFKVVEQAGEGLALMEAWEGADTVIILDAALSGAPAGAIHRIDASTELMPKDFFRCSTHTLGVTEVIELARALCQLPRRVIVYGIEGESFEAGAGLSAAVEKAASELEALVVQDVEAAARSVTLAD
jgi:hydrogenase maturation protease